MNEPVIIDEEILRFKPPISGEEYATLERSCLLNGIMEPLTVWNGILVDGHYRYKIAEENDLNYEVKDVSDAFKTKKDVIRWIVEESEEAKLRKIDFDDFDDCDAELIGHRVIGIILGYMKSGHIPDRMYARDTKDLVETVKYMMNSKKWRVVRRVHERTSKNK